jgi:hypothetical protein
MQMVRQHHDRLQLERPFGARHAERVPQRPDLIHQ